MNYNSNILVNINDFDKNRMSYIKPSNFYKLKSARNMGVYYKKNLDDENNDMLKNLPRQKIIIQTPKMTIPFDIQENDNGGKKSYALCLSFSYLTNIYNEYEIKNFQNFIREIDRVNEDTIDDYRKPWGLPKEMKYKKTLRRYKDFPQYMSISLPYDENIGFMFHIYDEKSNKADIDIIKKKSIVMAIIELTDLKFTETSYRSNWTLLQIRKFNPYSPIQEFFMSGCFILDPDNPEDEAYEKLIENYQRKITKPIPAPMIPQINPGYYRIHQNTPFQNDCISSSSYIPPPPPPTFTNPKPNNNKSNSNTKSFVPTLNQLLDTRKSLKKVTTIVKVGVEGKVVDNPKSIISESEEKKISPENSDEKKKKKKNRKKKNKSSDSE